MKRFGLTLEQGLEQYRERADEWFLADPAKAIAQKYLSNILGKLVS